VTRASVDIVVGATWKTDPRCLSRVYAFRRDDQDFDFSSVVDIIDIVIDGANITSRLPEDSIFNVMHDLVAGLAAMQGGRVDKIIVGFQEAPWELAVQSAGGAVELSFYCVGDVGGVAVHNLRVEPTELISGVCYATEKLLGDLLALNAAFSQESMVRALSQYLETLRRPDSASHLCRALGVDVPRGVGSIRRRVGDRKLSAEVAFDATHPDLWRYQGGLVSDLHSLLFKGTLKVRYWGRERVVAESAYVFPLVVDLLAGAEHLLRALEHHTGGAVILDPKDGVVALITAELADSDRVALRITDQSGGSGLTHTTPEILFDVLVGTARAVVDEVVDQNPSQSLNQRVSELRTRIEQLERQFQDVRRGDQYFDDVQSYLESANTLGLPTPAAPLNAVLPYPIREVRHVFLRSVWHMARNHLELSSLCTVDGLVVAASSGRLDAVNLADGSPRWSRAADALLGCSRSTAVTAREGGVESISLSTGDVSWSTTLPAVPEECRIVILDGRELAILTLPDASVASIDVTSGELAWRRRLEHGEVLGLCPAGPVLVVLSDDGFAYGLEPGSGELLWKVRVPGTSHLPPVYHQGRLYLTADNEPGYEGVLLGIYPLTGRRIFDVRLPAIASCAPLVTGSLGIFAVEHGTSAGLYTVDLESGTAMWSMGVDSANVDTPCLCLAGTDPDAPLIVKSDTGVCTGVELSTGRTIWRTSLVEPGDVLLSNVPPINVDGHLVVAERFVSVVDPRTGERLHRFQGVTEHPSYLHVGRELRLLIGDGDDHLECFDISGFLALVPSLDAEE